MNKKFILMSMMMLILLPLHAQLTVTKAGQTIVGKHMRKGTTPPITPLEPVNAAAQGSVIVMPDYVKLDSLATAVFLGKEDNNNGGYVTFGGNKNVWVGELSTKTSSLPAIMELGGMCGFRGTSRLGTVFGYRLTPSATTTAPFRFYTDLRANSFVVDSDSRIKANVKELEDVSDLLCGLSPISYTLISQTAVDSPAIMMDGVAEATLTEEMPAQPSDRTRYGFMAQEVKEIFPELVTEDEDGTLGIDYIGFIPLLVNAVKDLRTLVADQQKEIEALSGNYVRMRKADGSAAGVDGVVAEVCGMGQNRPNPFTGTTSVDCMLPESVETAELYVYDLQGGQKLHLPVTERGAAVVTVDGQNLAPGMYIYVLVADGMEIDSKRMIVTE